MTISNYLLNTSSSLIYRITSNQENLNLQTIFGANKYQSKIEKRIIINSGVIVGSNQVANYALSIPSGFGGKMILVNEGSILGAGGAGDTGSGAGNGGNCINAGAPNIYIDNRGTISGGGGGGGKGGNGGGGVYTTQQSYDCSYTACGGGSGFHGAGSWNGACQQQNNNGGCYCQNGNNGVNGPTRWACCQCCCPVQQTCSQSTNNFTSGGSGGNGGRGQGYDGSSTSGTAGSSGGINAGTGGTGGTGGAYGSSGNTGNTGFNGNNGGGISGQPGGLAGYYIVNNGNVNWVANGTRNGRIG